MLKDIAEKTFQIMPVTQDEADVAQAFYQYLLNPTPVDDEDGCIAGVIIIHDAIVILDEDYEENILRLAGVVEVDLSDTVLQTTWQCVPWLAVNLVAAILRSLANKAGMQILTVAARPLASKELTGSNVRRVPRLEVFVGLINGTLFVVLMGVAGVI